MIQAILSSCSTCDDSRPVLDIGSNVGQFSAMMRAMGCNVVAVDPQEEVSRFFELMVLTNDWDLDGSISHHVAYLGEQDGEKLVSKKLWAPGERRVSYDRRVPQLAVSSLVNRDFAFVKIDVDGPEGIILRQLSHLIPQYHVGSIMVEVEISSWKKHYSISDEEAISIFHSFYNLNYHPYLTFLDSLKDVEEVERLHVIPKLRHFENVAYIPRENMRATLFSEDKFTKNIFMDLGDEWSPQR